MSAKPKQKLVRRKELGYLDVYDRLRSWQRELNEMRGILKPHVTEMSKCALDTLNGTLYLVQGQLISDADGAN